MITDSEFNIILNTNIKNKSVKTFVDSMYNNNKILDENSIILALIYLDRYNRTKKINNKDILDLLETAILLSNKFLLDLEILDKGKYEKDLINALEWNFFVTDEEFINYKRLLYNVKNYN
tara:strand:+ start:264 stop:623 length:360 start_codon:yes stop_codon:yes gene_type:complete